MGYPMLRFAMFVMLVLSAACSSGPTEEQAYLKEIDDYRASRDQFMRTDADSPIPPDQRDILLPLQYYPPDPSFSTAAVLRLADQRPVFEMPTSTGTVRRMQRVGVLQFTLKGESMSLGAFVEEGTQQISQLFVPFADQTTGKGTYEAGRYLDLHPTATNIYTIDFNRAYNPYCAYNKSYECPYPPPTNRLKIAVTAGEKMQSAAPTKAPA
jgi:uncharacterized protein